MMACASPTASTTPLSLPIIVHALVSSRPWASAREPGPRAAICVRALWLGPGSSLRDVRDDSLAQCRTVSRHHLPHGACCDRACALAMAGVADGDRQRVGLVRTV